MDEKIKKIFFGEVGEACLVPEANYKFLTVLPLNKPNKRIAEN